MKRILSLAILAASAVSLVGCNARTPIEGREGVYKASGKWEREEFEGHTYITRWDPVLDTSGITHDPDCKCGGRR